MGDAHTVTYFLQGKKLVGLPESDDVLGSLCPMLRFWSSGEASYSQWEKPVRREEQADILWREFQNRGYSLSTAFGICLPKKQDVLDGAPVLHGAPPL